MPGRGAAYGAVQGDEGADRALRRPLLHHLAFPVGGERHHGGGLTGVAGPVGAPWAHDRGRVGHPITTACPAAIRASLRLTPGAVQTVPRTRPYLSRAWEVTLTGAASGWPSPSAGIRATMRAVT